jgi:hypothetical protein
LQLITHFYHPYRLVGAGKRGASEKFKVEKRKKYSVYEYKN